MWKKVLAGISVLALVMVAFAGAVYAQAENAELRVSEKLDGKIAEYKAAKPEWTKRLKSPEHVLFLGTVVAFVAGVVAGYFAPPVVDVSPGAGIFFPHGTAFTIGTYVGAGLSFMGSASP